ncbi:MAG: radical SAM family heme chaperone HemW, partial [Mycetocola sp.]
MAGPQPLGDPAPADGRLPDSAAAAAVGVPFGAYVHVPFCRVRCGYCDFNTYTATELRGAKQSDYHDEVAREVELSLNALSISGVAPRPLSTVFFGGGTPTLLPADDLVEMLAALRSGYGIVPGAEITTEANPDSVDEAYLTRLREGGFTRVSFGVQSAVPSTLATLERSHDPAKVPEVVRAAKAAGLAVSVDLIYGAPGETIAEWERSVDLAIELEPEHISAYALIVEDGTKLARQIRSGQLSAPDDDLQAEMYELADSRFAEAGFDWYEISNWSRSEATRSQHNLSYWTGSDWWGFGPGAHSHVGGVR